MNIREVLLAILAHNSAIFTEMNTGQIGGVIKARREVLGIDQRTLSEIAGVAVHTVSNIEAGSGNPTVKSLDKVLGTLGMELRVDLQKQE